MEQDINLVDLPKDNFTEIITQIVRTTGIPAIQNNADIPVIAKYLTWLSCTNKMFYTTVNNPPMVQLIIKEMAARFGIPEINAALHLKTPSAQAWLQSHMLSKPEDVIMTGIDYVLHTAAQEFIKEHALIQIILTSIDIYNPTNTRQTIFMTTQENRDSYDIIFYTPWGKYTYLIKPSSGWIECIFDLFMQHICNKLSATIEHIPKVKSTPLKKLKENNLTSNIGIVLFYRNIYEDIDYADAKKLLTTNQVFSHHHGPCTYRMHTVAGHKLPSPNILDNTLQHILDVQRRQIPEYRLLPRQKNNESYAEPDEQPLDTIDQLSNWAGIRLENKTDELIYKYVTGALEPESINDFIQLITTGWQRTTLENCSGILCKLSPADYFLVKKEFEIPGVYSFMRLIAHKLKLTGKLISTWKRYKLTGSEFHDDSFTTYLWIRKDAHDEVINKLRLQINE